MQQLLKRLELIKTSITLEDEEIIELQILKIKTLNPDAKVAAILSLLELNDFATALKNIKAYIASHTGLVEYEDTEIQGLKLELKVLERRIQQLSEQVNDCNNDINEFNRDYSAKLGWVIRKILVTREQILYQQVLLKKQSVQVLVDEYKVIKADVEDTKTKIGDIESLLDELNEFSDDYETLYEHYQSLKEELSEKEAPLKEQREACKQAKIELEEDTEYQEYEAAVEEAEDFEQEYEAFIEEDNYELDDEQAKALKIAYRKACKLCHPDIVSDELKEDAHRIMSELNIAKQKNDFAKVKEILSHLESEKSFNIASNTLEDKSLLKAKIKEIKQKIIVLESDLNTLTASETYRDIQSIEDKAAYFELLEVELKTEYERLTVELNQLIHPKTDEELEFEQSIENYSALSKETEEKSDDYWTEEF